MLSETRQDQLLRGQTAVARKVYDVVPLRERWNQTQIRGELERVGKSVEHRVLAGCLSALTEAGLISNANGQYMREPVRPALAKTIQEQEKPMSKPSVTLVAQPAPAANDPFERMMSLATMLREVADKVEDVAVDVQQMLEANQGDVAKLRQLQTLLKGLA